MYTFKKEQEEHEDDEKNPFITTQRTKYLSLRRRTGHPLLRKVQNGASLREINITHVKLRSKDLILEQVEKIVPKLVKYSPIWN